ncbi:RHS repeat-associated core domain-containing protein [Haloplasma contractile]|uniref:Cell wall associated protein n=1 Tax=Haloplasma contractile SSD-17B TaxID=1033810 RepID=U2DTE6_9MOLU|nr:RHS repeat-associated core domain-containing protein [Haloplasma contractile]ERJ11757.1 putative cell wall associated protein [Haloplasma contractile SSD-17B]
MIYKYTYDSDGNIERIKVGKNVRKQRTVKTDLCITGPDGTEECIKKIQYYTATVWLDQYEYEYDSLNQLIREDISLTGAEDSTTIYEYDHHANLTSKIIYEYQPHVLKENLTNNTRIKEFTYVYKTDEDVQNGGWKDQLKSVTVTEYSNSSNNESYSMTYDHQGNPETYKDYDLEWFGRQLETIKIKDTSTTYVSYKYNDSGFRTSKTVGNVTTNYFLEGDSVLYESDGSYEIYFTYDVDGQLISFYYDENKDDHVRGHEYYYIRNIQGDIVKIVDDSGDVLVEYKYDAWGNILDTVDNTDFDLAKMNPYRYRGYHYDEETGWYYLNSRYYNPEIGRFINADDSQILLMTRGEVLSHNLYAYSMNNPVMMVDPSGYWPNWNNIGEGIGLVILGVGAVAVGVATLPFGGGLTVVAGVTILAGVGTTAFGLAEIGEGLTDYNVIRDTVFNGDQSNYDLTKDIFQYTAIVGSTICSAYGISHTSVINTRSTPRTHNANSAVFNRQSNVLTYYGKNAKMKYSVGFFEKGHQWIHWYTELRHSKPINNVLKFIWEMAKRGF